MKDIKKKQIMIELIVLICLSVVAMVLIVQREIKKADVKNPTPMAKTEKSMDVNMVAEAEDAANEEPVEEAAEEVLEEAHVEPIVLEDGLSASVVKNAAEKRVLESDAFFTRGKLVKAEEEEWQMAEISGYWDAYKLDAVADLIRLERVRILTNNLDGTNHYYYYGDLNSNGEPEGKGLSIYANNAYYYGEWKAGVRSGRGMWIQFYDHPIEINGNKGIIEQSYNGMWENDYPNGQGQLHVDYDTTTLTEEPVIANVIGGFADGYCHGEMYVMAITATRAQVDWMAEAEYGVFKPLEPTPNAQGEYPVWERLSSIIDGEELIEYMSPEENSGFGIYGLLK